MESQKMVPSKLILDWSPEQISGWLKVQYPDDESMRMFVKAYSIVVGSRSTKQEKRLTP